MTFTCPRRIAEGHADENGPFVFDGPNRDSYDRPSMGSSDLMGCSYCGSVSGEDFIRVVREHTVVGPTDKSYKLYLDDHHAKFYMHHLTPKQGDEFIALWNAGEVNWGYPGAPYVQLYVPHNTEDT